MINSIAPVGDGLILLLPDNEAAAFTQGKVGNVEAIPIGIAFDAPHDRGTLSLPREAAQHLVETDGKMYIYGTTYDRIIADYMCVIEIEKGPLYKALGAWEVLYLSRSESNLE